MKRLNFLIITLCVASILTGCGGKGSQAVDTNALEMSFAGAEPAIKAVVDKAVVAVKAADYSSAVIELSKLNKSDKLSFDQQKTVKLVLSQAEQMAAASPPKTVESLPMAMPK